MTNKLPYEEKALELLHRLKQFTIDDIELEFILSGVIDNEASIDELIQYIDKGEDVNLDNILDYAYYLSDDD